MLPVLGTEPLPLDEQGFTATVFEAGRPAWSDDVQHDPRFAYRLFRRFPHRSGLIIPLVLDGAPAGAFYLVWWKEARRFEPAEMTVLEKIGQQVGVLLRNVRLRDALDTRAARLATLVRLGHLVSSSLQTDEVLGEIARAAAELMSARVVHVWVVDEAGETLELKATSDAEISRDFSARVVRIDEGGIGRAVARREMLAFPDVFADGSPVLEPRWWKHHGFSSLLDVPIIHENTPIDGHGTSGSSVVGVLALHGARPFVLGEDERAVLGGFVAQAAVALHHARSYEVQGRLLVQTRQQEREALALEATAREITSSLAGREVFARITERVRELCGADVAYLATREDTGGARVVAVAGARTGAIAKLVLRPGTEAGRQVLEHATVVRVGADDSEAATREGLTTQVLIPLIVRDTVERARSGLGVASDRGEPARPLPRRRLSPLGGEGAITSCSAPKRASTGRRAASPRWRAAKGSWAAWSRRASRSCCPTWPPRTRSTWNGSAPSASCPPPSCRSSATSASARSRW
jgi:GAF domain-containing protein